MDIGKRYKVTTYFNQAFTGSLRNVKLIAQGTLDLARKMAPIASTIAVMAPNLPSTVDTNYTNMTFYVFEDSEGVVMALAQSWILSADLLDASAAAVSLELSSVTPAMLEIIKTHLTQLGVAYRVTSS